MALGKVSCTCADCGSDIHFSTYADFGDFTLEDAKPWIMSTTLHGSTVICHKCKTHNVYLSRWTRKDKIEKLEDTPYEY